MVRMDNGAIGQSYYISEIVGGNNELMIDAIGMFQG